MTETNGIFVCGLPVHTRLDDLWKVFSCDESCRFDYVLFPLARDNSKAYIHFTSHPERVMKRDLKVLGDDVSVEPAPWPAFAKCTADVDPVVIASIPDVPQCIAALKEDFGVSADYSSETGRFLVEGSCEQLSCVQVRLQEILAHQQEVQKRQLRRLSSRSRDHRQYDNSTDQGRDLRHSVTGSHHQSHHQPAAAAAAAAGYHRTMSCEYDAAASNWTCCESDTSASPWRQVQHGGPCSHMETSCGHLPRFSPPVSHPPGPAPAPDDPASPCVTSDLDYYVFEYVRMSQLARMSDIEQEFGVTIKSVNRICDDLVTVAFQRYNPTIHPDNEEKAHRAFLALYETVYRSIVQRTVEANFKPPMTATDLLSAIRRFYGQQIFASVNSEDVFTLVGPFNEVAAVEKFILKRSTDQASGNPHARDAGKFQYADHLKESSGSEVDPERPVSEFEVGGKLKVKVYSADITGLAVDVIVNAANELLQNYGGVAGAVERAGGEELRQDCEKIIQQGGPLKVAEVVHSERRGQLKCRYVVHTVGPIWTESSDKSRCSALLQRTFENVLDYSHRLLHATSIAVPAISTGIFGVPLDVCAQSMYHAIKTVADGVSSLSLREVHLVNINRDTTQFIQSVFLQLTSSGSSTQCENSTPIPFSVVDEPQEPSSDADQSPFDAGYQDEVHEIFHGLVSENVQNSALKTPQNGKITLDGEDIGQVLADAQDCIGRDKGKDHGELCDLPPENAETSDLESSQNGNKTLDEEGAEDLERLLVESQDRGDHRDEETLDQQLVKEQDLMLEKLSSDGLDAVESSDEGSPQDQENHGNHEPVMQEDDQKSDGVPETENTQDEENQTFDLEFAELDQKITAYSQPLMDQEHNRTLPCDEGLNTAEDSQTLETYSGIKDLETGETAGAEERHHLSSKLEPPLDTIMQELNLEQYCEEVPPSHRHEPTPGISSDLPEDASRRPRDGGPWSLGPNRHNHHQDDCEKFYSLSPDTDRKTDPFA